MQRVFGEPGSPWLTPRFAEIVDPIRRLAEAFRPQGDLHQVRGPRGPARRVAPYYDQWPFALQPPDAPIYELVDPFAAMAGPTLDATTFSKWGPELAARAGGGPLVLAGVSTDCCVLSTALAAADDGAGVRVVADACAGVDDESHAQTLHIMSLYGPLVEVVTVADVLGEARPAEPSPWAGQPRRWPAQERRMEGVA